MNISAWIIKTCVNWRRDTGDDRDKYGRQYVNDWKKEVNANGALQVRSLPTQIWDTEDCQPYTQLVGIRGAGAEISTSCEWVKKKFRSKYPSSEANVVDEAINVIRS